MGNLSVKTPAFDQGQSIPKRYTGEGEDVSPKLEWSEVPAGTQSIALICDDPDAPVGIWVHWVLFNLPPTTRSLDEGMPKDRELKNGARHGNNDWKQSGYRGPMPPPGKAHRYFFRVYALDAKMDLPTGATRQQLLEAMKSHILAQGEVMGTYRR
jgi:Raf kinase inhibitor-like YbhB/YbcL family protein